MTEKKDTNPKDSVGIKKAPLSVLSGPVLYEMGLGMAEGARKYGKHNWREKGVLGSVYFDATMRHLWSWFEGEDVDPDSGLSHITKAMTSLLVLRDAMISNNFRDDRPIKSVIDMNSLAQKIDDLIVKYPNSVPPYTEKKDY